MGCQCGTVGYQDIMSDTTVLVVDMFTVPIASYREVSGRHTELVFDSDEFRCTTA